MRIGMVVSDLLEFGGLEKIATEVAVGLQQQGQSVSVISAGWTPPNNQYRAYLRQNGVAFYQSPRWLYLAAVDWSTKERILATALWICSPLTLAGAVAVLFARRKGWTAAWASARGWLARTLLGWIGLNRREALARWLLAWWQWRWRPDVIHLHGYTSSLLFVLDWAAVRGVPTVYTEHQTPDPHFDWWQAFDRTINKATVVVACSDASAQALREIANIQRPIVTFLPAVADPTTEGHMIALRRLPPGAPLTVTTIARQGVTKGLVYLLDSIKQVRQDFPDTQFRVYGDGPLQDELAAYAAKLGLEYAEIFVGTFSRADLPAIMAQTDILLMSSVLEGTPLALVEAMAYGRPIIATMVGGIPAIVTHEVNGLLCPPRDLDCLSRQLVHLLGDAEMRERLGQAARRAYENGAFAPKAVARHHIAIYEQALATARVTPSGTAA